MNQKSGRQGLWSIPGDGVLARQGSLVLLSAIDERGLLERLLDLLAAASENGADGRAFTDAVQRALESDESWDADLEGQPSPAVVAFGPAGPGMAIIVTGTAWADVTTGHGTSHLSAGQPLAALRCLVGVPVQAVRGGLGTGGGASDRTDRFSRLDSGTTRAGGLSYRSGLDVSPTADPVAPPEAPAESGAPGAAGAAGWGPALDQPSSPAPGEQPPPRSVPIPRSAPPWPPAPRPRTFAPPPTPPLPAAFPVPEPAPPPVAEADAGPPAAAGAGTRDAEPGGTEPGGTEPGGTQSAASGAAAAGTADAGLSDAAPSDALPPDALPGAALPEAGLPEAASPEAAFPEAALPAGAVPEAAPPDAGFADAGWPGTAPPDAVPPDAAAPDAAAPDAGRAEAGQPDAAPPDEVPPDEAARAATPVNARPEDGAAAGLAGLGLAEPLKGDGAPPRAVTELAAVPGFAAEDAAPAAAPAGSPAEADRQAPIVVGVYCKNGHFGDPAARTCAVCGASRGRRGLPPEAGRRPPLGALVLDDGSAMELDTDCVIGRDPGKDPAVISGEARPLRIADPELTVSRVHARVHLDGWEVQLIDLGSANGTRILPPGKRHEQDLQPNVPVRLEGGTQVFVGAQSFRYETSPAW